VSNVEQYLITGSATDLRPLHDLLASDPEVAVIEVRPERLVIAMDPLRREALSTAFGKRFTIEEDWQVAPPENPIPD
jgi:hypothetical protein